MKTSLDRKIERAAREAAAERAKRGPTLTVDRFNKDDHQPDGTVRPPKPPANPIFHGQPGIPFTSGAQRDAGMSPKPQRQWVRAKGMLGIWWQDTNEARLAYYETASEDEPPKDDLSNVSAVTTRHAIAAEDVRTALGAIPAGTVIKHVGVDLAAGAATVTTTKPPLGAKPRRLHNEIRMRELDEAMARYKMAGLDVPAEWVAERNDLSIDETRLGANPVASAMDVLRSLVQNDPGYAVSWFANLSMAFKDAARWVYPLLRRVPHGYQEFDEVAPQAAKHLMVTLFGLSHESELFKDVPQLELGVGSSKRKRTLEWFDGRQWGNDSPAPSTHDGADAMQYATAARRSGKSFKSRLMVEWNVTDQAEREKCLEDLALFGIAFVKDGKRVDPTTVHRKPLVNEDAIYNNFVEYHLGKPYAWVEAKSPEDRKAQPLPPFAEVQRALEQDAQLAADARDRAVFRMPHDAYAVPAGRKDADPSVYDLVHTMADGTRIYRPKR